MQIQRLKPTCLSCCAPRKWVLSKDSRPKYSSRQQYEIRIMRCDFNSHHQEQPLMILFITILCNKDFNGFIACCMTCCPSMTMQIISAGMFTGSVMNGAQILFRSNNICIILFNTYMAGSPNVSCHNQKETKYRWGNWTSPEIINQWKVTKKPDCMKALGLLWSFWECSRTYCQWVPRACCPEFKDSFHWKSTNIIHSSAFENS